MNEFLLLLLPALYKQVRPQAEHDSKNPIPRRINTLVERVLAWSIAHHLVYEEHQAEKGRDLQKSLESRKVQVVEREPLSVVLFEQVDWLAVLVPVAEDQRLGQLVPVLVYAFDHGFVGPGPVQRVGIMDDSDRLVMLEIDFLLQVPLDACVPLSSVESLECIFHVLVELVSNIAHI